MAVALDQQSGERSQHDEWEERVQPSPAPPQPLAAAKRSTQRAGHNLEEPRGVGEGAAYGVGDATGILTKESAGLSEVAEWWEGSC